MVASKGHHPPKTKSEANRKFRLIQCGRPVGGFPFGVVGRILEIFVDAFPMLGQPKPRLRHGDPKGLVALVLRRAGLPQAVLCDGAILVYGSHGVRPLSVRYSPKADGAPRQTEDHS